LCPWAIGITPPFSKTLSDTKMDRDSAFEPSRIREISDRLEIEDLLIRYCTALDTKQFDLLDTVFTEDATLDYMSAGGIRGTRSEVKAWLQGVLSLFPVTQHLITNFSIEIDGDHATSRCALFNPLGAPHPEAEKGLQVAFVGGYYNDTLVRRDGQWRILERVEESTWSR
jgi:hypothetical protein